jgi:hypothetical protein
MASNNLMSRGLPASSPLSLIKEWHVAMAWTNGESNCSVVGSGTLSMNWDPRVSQTADRSRFPSVNVPVYIH